MSGCSAVKQRKSCHERGQGQEENIQAMLLICGASRLYSQVHLGRDLSDSSELEGRYAEDSSSFKPEGGPRTARG